MKRRFLIIILLVLSVGFISVNAKASMTIATFADPSIEGTPSLFTVDFRPAQMKLTGGWADTETGSGLTLEIPYSDYTIENGNAFHDAWFVVTGRTTAEVVILNTAGDTDGGEINFYEHGTTTNPLLTISFDSGYVDYVNFGADEFFAENVTISGIGITPGLFTDEFFSFGFANTTLLPGSNDLDDGFTATAVFTSSAVPEPATICLFGLCALSLIRRKK